MKFANANKVDRKSGIRFGEPGAPVQGEGLRCALALQGVLGTGLDQGEKLGAGVLLVEDSYHRRGHG
jgi:hypothetical protein